ncbi:g3737 [Coccomyxa viridis]|uniref:3-dehydrosphinganine reductase n=1 Tax=Coccomyxa viridis TaxID=1274662 RepID=A0ABP1FNJ8_9CHLO
MLWGRKKSFLGAHVVITGGSTGIGFALAQQFVSKGAHVILIARTKSRLDTAVAELRKRAKASDRDVNIRGFPADTTDPSQIAAALKYAGEVDVLVCCAGASYPGRFLEQDVQVFEETMNLNYFGTLRVLKAFLPGMVRRGEGEVVLVSSAAAVCGVAGYSSYAPSKAAVRSLADTLRNELLPTGVHVSVAYPPDTDTPGYANENTTKPSECHAISRAAGDVLYTPDQVAECMMRGLEQGAYHLPSPDFGQNLMVAASAGLSPHAYNGLLEFLLAPFVALALRIFGKIVDKAVLKHAAS